MICSIDNYVMCFIIALVVVMSSVLIKNPCKFNLCYINIMPCFIGYNCLLLKKRKTKRIIMPAIYTHTQIAEQAYHKLGSPNYIKQHLNEYMLGCIGLEFFSLSKHPQSIQEKSYDGTYGYMHAPSS